jgi:hypothetical protein
VPPHHERHYANASFTSTYASFLLGQISSFGRPRSQPPAILHPWHGHAESQAVQHSTLIFPSPCFRLSMLSQCDSQQPNKLHPRSIACVFVGYPSTHHGYHCYDPISRRIIISQNVTFDEFVFLFSQTSPKPVEMDLDYLQDSMVLLPSWHPRATASAPRMEPPSP